MEKTNKNFFERIASKIPDPVILFLMMYAVLFVVTVFAGGMSFSLPGVDPASGERIEVVCAAYRTADPCTNIVTPVMTYVGVILLFCRRYVPRFAVGDLLLMMVPYSALFLATATALMIAWFKLGIPFGF